MTATKPAVPAANDQANEVVLRGRLAAEPAERSLPSGDTIMTLRLVIDRVPPPSAQSRSRQRVDTIDCVVWSGRLQRSMRTWQPGDVVQVEGAIRRRFFRGTSGPVSRVEVEVLRGRRARAAAR